MPRKSDILPHLRRELKETWPAVKFSVKRHRGTAYGWADVSYTDGPSRKLVDAVAYKYQACYFDGMDDGYHSTGNKLPDGCSGMSGILVRRDLSPAFEDRLIATAIDQYPPFAELLAADENWQNATGDWIGSRRAICHTLAEDRTASLVGFFPR